MSSPGVTLKSMTAKPIATANAKMSAPRESSVATSSGPRLPWRFLCRVVRRDRERAEADRERLAERHHAADDRAAGRRRWRAIAESIDFETCAMSPLGVRTATAQLPGPRIITPSRTACPPTVDAIAALAGRAALGALCALEALLEALHAAARVHELLLARVERMAVRADLDVQLRLRRAGLERVPAGARHRGERRTRDGCQPS